MSPGGLILGLINIAIVVVVWLFLGAIVYAFCKWMGWALIDDRVQKLFIAFVALIALYMLIALFLGLPTIRVIGSSRSDLPIGGWIPAPASIMKEERRG